MYHESFAFGIGVGLFCRFRVWEWKAQCSCAEKWDLCELLHKEGNAITLRVTLSY